MLTLEQLRKIARSASEPRLINYIQPLNEAMEWHQIAPSLVRQAAFISQICYETKDFYLIREMASGKEYEGLKVLGNTEPGDGPLFISRGLLPIRGRFLYDLCSEALGVDFLKNPTLLEELPHSVKSAAWYWAEYWNMNPLADKDDIIRIAGRLNNKFEGLANRIVYYDRANHVFHSNP